ncbi:MAG TPA: hypothetical protein DEF79_07475 [Gammaproteobacteria bacterium]|nr:hypothetical protein [Gammaproteobacteria bacterium]
MKWKRAQNDDDWFEFYSTLKIADAKYVGFDSGKKNRIKEPNNEMELHERLNRQHWRFRLLTSSLIS